MVEEEELPPLLRGPFLPRGLAQDGLEPPEGAGLGEPKVLDAGEFVEGQILLVDLALQAAVRRREDAGDHGGDGDRPEVPQDADPLVPLLDVEIVEVFIDLDGVVDAGGKVGVAEGRPLGGQFRALLQQGVEAAGKGPLPPGGPGADDQFNGDVHQPQIHFPPGVHPLQHLVQHRGVGAQAL